MFTRKTKHIDQPLQDAIAGVYEDMSGHQADSREYAQCADQLSKLYEIQSLTKKDESRVSPDTLALVLGNLAGVVLIVGHERAHVVTSKALAFVQKLK